MADIKRKFRAEDGLDAGGDKIINVALADRTIGTEGVNVDFLTQENTVQQYDTTRGYLKDFVVVYNNRFWISSRDIDSPAGAFNELYWTALRTDAKWLTIASGAHQLISGQSISVDTAPGTDMVFTLPSSPLDGDTIVLKDIGGRTGYTSVQIKSSIQSMVDGFGNQVTTLQMTHPRSQIILVFSNRLWYVYSSDFERVADTVTPAAVFEAQPNDFIVRRFTSGAPIRIKLPKNANHGDMIDITDLDKLNPLYHTIYTTYDTTTSIREAGTHTIETRTTGGAFLIFDAAERLWRVWTGDLKSRLNIVRDDVTMSPNEEILVYGIDNTVINEIVVTLPTGVELGDSVKISLNYMRKGQTVKIRAAAGDSIASSVALLQFPKRSEYPPDGTWVQTPELEFNGTTSYVPVLELSYIENTDSGLKYWVVQQCVTTVERVDSLNDSTRARLGVIALANQNQANADHESSPAKELAITPETLANRVATESRRGIARIATTAQVNQDTTFAFQDDLIISPKKLNERTATETRRGVAEIATQVETNTGTDDTTIITPKKLQTRQGSETLSGIVTYTSTTGTTPATDRASVGTNVYNKNVDNLVISPKALDQYKASQVQQGAVYLATQVETDTGTSATGFKNSAVSPETLNARRSTDANHGLIEIATQTEVNTGTDYTRAVTPKTLNDRNATQTLTGIARIGTQVEFDAGLLDNVISTPLKVKTYFDDTARTSVSSASGLIEAGTLWNHYTLDIREASNTQRGTARLATQLEVNAGTDDKTIITPLKLQAKKATETTEGIVQLATQAEVVAGLVDNKAFSPKIYKYVVQQEKSWEATPSTRGYVKISEGSITWVGNDTSGSTQNVDLYEKSGYAISPYELNKTLSHYLPIKGKAFDSDLLDGLDSLQFIRRDIDQTVNGSLTLTKQLNLGAPLVSSANGKFASLDSTSYVNAADKFVTKDWDLASSATELSINHLADKKLSITSDGNATLKAKFTANMVDSSKGFSVEGGTIIINPQVSEIIIGTQSRKISMHAADGNTFTVTDPSGTYNILNTKNAQTILNPTYVRKAGDSMTGALAISNTLTVQIPEGTVVPDMKPSASNGNSWNATILTKAIYDKLPGYMVPKWATDSTGGQLPYVDSYTEVKGPGILTQHGIGTTNVYQMWCPRPVDLVGNNAAQTFWTRNFNTASGNWDGWCRLFTSGTPPLASDLGAASVAGSVFDNLRIQNWIQIGNVRITSNPNTQSVDFEWVP